MIARASAMKEATFTIFPVPHRADPDYTIALPAFALECFAGVRVRSIREWRLQREREERASEVLYQRMAELRELRNAVAMEVEE